VFYFPCARCGQPTAISDFHSWSYGDPLCSEACAAQPTPEGRRETRTAEEVMDQTLALLLETGELVRRSSERASRAESDMNTSAALSSTVGVMALGVLPGAIMSAVHESSENAYSQTVHDIQDRLSTIIRNAMALEGLGVPAAQHVIEVATRYGSLSATAAGMQGVLTQLWHHLKHTYDALSATRATARGPFR